MVGTFGSGSLTLSGGAATAASLNAGLVAGSSATIDILSGSTLTLSGAQANGDGALLQIGREGAATMNVTGAAVTIDDLGAAAGLPGGLLVGGGNTAGDGLGDGTLNIGAGGSVTVSTGFTQIGRNAAAILNVAGGGVLDGLAQTVSVVGRTAAASGNVTVDGAGSHWNAGQNLFVATDVNFATQTALGGGGTGTVTVSNGGLLTAINVLIDGGGTLTGSGGTVAGNVTVTNGGIFAPGSSPGTMTINGDLEIDTGVLQLETEGGLSDEIAVSGSVTIGAGATVELYFDVLPSTVDIDSFFSVAQPTYDAGFDGSSIFAFVSDASFVGQTFDVFFGGNESPLSVVAQFSGEAVPAPGAALLLLLGVAGMVAGRRLLDRRC